MTCLTLDSGDSAALRLGGSAFWTFDKENQPTTNPTLRNVNKVAGKVQSKSKGLTVVNMAQKKTELLPFFHRASEDNMFLDVFSRLQTLSHHHTLLSLHKVLVNDHFYQAFSKISSSFAHELAQNVF